MLFDLAQGKKAFSWRQRKKRGENRFTRESEKKKNFFQLPFVVEFDDDLKKNKTKLILSSIRAGGETFAAFADPIKKIN